MRGRRRGVLGVLMVLIAVTSGVPLISAQEASPVVPTQVVPATTDGSPVPVDAAAAGQVLLNGEPSSVTVAPGTVVLLDSNPRGLNAGVWFGSSCAGQKNLSIQTEDNAIVSTQPNLLSYQMGVSTRSYADEHSDCHATPRNADH
jgi:hypothetical protein